MLNVMLDIETLGTNSNSVILSIAAVEFDFESGKTGRTFYQKIDLQSAVDIGMKIDTGTLVWWMDQSKEQMKEMFEDPKPIKEVLSEFKYWLQGEKKILWGNGPRFDLGLMANAFKLIGEEIPWNYYDERCVRTLSDLAPEVRKLIPRKEAHNALADCYYQIEYCSAIYQKIKSNA